MRTLSGCLSWKLNWETLAKCFEGENVLLVPSLPSEPSANVPLPNSSALLGVLVVVWTSIPVNWEAFTPKFRSGEWCFLEHDLIHKATAAALVPVNGPVDLISSIPLFTPDLNFGERRLVKRACLERNAFCSLFSLSLTSLLPNPSLTLKLKNEIVKQWCSS